MERIITYSTINSNLRPSSTLSPSNRCACKKNALEAHGKNIYGTDAAFPQNRLIWNYDLEEFTVTWDFGGAPGYNPSLVSVDYGTKVADASKPADPTWADHRFDGWFIGDTPLGQLTVTGNTTVTAHWTYTPPAPTYTISFIDKDGGSLGSQTGHSGDTVTTPNAPAVSGYIFTGWLNTSNPSDFIPAGTTTITVSGNATYQATYRSEHTVEMIANVFWKVDSDGGGILHGDGNIYENTQSDWLPSNNIPINLRYEPMYRSVNSYTGGTEYSYYQNIATVDGTSITHEDLDFTVIVGTSSQSHSYNLNLLFRTTDGTNDSQITKIVYNSNGTYTDDGYTHKGHGLAVSSTTWDQDFYWRDSIPVTYIASYNGIEVYRKTINIVAYGGDAITGIPFWGSEPNPGTIVGGSISDWGGSWLYSEHHTTPEHPKGS